jgi:predicted RNase H-like nuclease (RuvC/YqgF family)
VLRDGNYYNEDNLANAQKAYQAVVDRLNDIIFAFAGSLRLQSDRLHIKQNVPILDGIC